ncbi:type II secretion system F family protein [Streptomyces sp. N2-109]|uniref:Type II secretion system F family protein n=1 Tax=Streptomyces gossypii TaxID=2883101 RepID=A0ABT2JRP5_9ACTN|nr:type II secretion system F family protein [Streptomyces gossypii]MCT2589914.1 type II secretion system F family protein [Streptomyces gossypii]
MFVPRVWTALALLGAAVCALDVLRGWRRDQFRRRRAYGLVATLPGGAGRTWRGIRRAPVPGSAQTPTVPAVSTRTRLPGVGRRLSARWERALPLVVLAFGVIVVGGVPGVVGGCAGAYGGRVWLRARARDETAVVARWEASVSAGQLPLAAELLAACFAAGSGPGQAAAAVGRSLGGPLGDRLLRAATELGLGGEPGAVWGRFGALPGHEGLARCLERAGSTGVPAVEPVSRLAAECRARRARTAAGRARRAAVLVTGPLGLCFLPAFLAVGVAPVVLGLADALL